MVSNVYQWILLPRAGQGPRYAPITITVRTTDGREVQSIRFLVKKNAECEDLWTTKEYVNHILNGLRQYGAPREYVEHVITTAVERN